MTEGVVRAPSEFSMTLDLPPSMTATQELVVPRSMPMILPMMNFPYLYICNLCEWIRGANPSNCCRYRQYAAHGGAFKLFFLRNRHQRRAQQTVGDQVALLQHADDGIRLLIGRHHRDRLVPHRVELLAR